MFLEFTIILLPMDEQTHLPQSEIHVHKISTEMMLTTNEVILEAWI